MSDYGIFSIGHSTQPLVRFISLLKQNDIDVVADVRSSPYSKFNPQFNRETIAKALENFKIQYFFLGNGLGARPKDPSCYVDGKVRFEKLAERDEFKHAIAHLLRGMRDHRIALMCAEKEPLECHRTILVSQALIKSEKGCEVKHILYDGSIETHTETLGRLYDVTGVPREDLFKSGDELLAEALSRQAVRIAYEESRSEFEKQGA